MGFFYIVVIKINGIVNNRNFILYFNEKGDDGLLKWNKN